MIIAVAAFGTAALLSSQFKHREPAFLSKDYQIHCGTHETREMIQLDAAKPGFAQLHHNPIAYQLKNPIGNTIQFTTPDGTTASGYYLPAKKKSNRWLLVIQEWWGLNDHIKREAEAYYRELGNVNVLALDMYDGKIATTRDSAMKYMTSALPGRLENIVKGALALAGKEAKIYTLGWCFGGGWSLQSSILAGSQAAGCVIFYGRPETNVARLQTIQCDVIGFFGNKDQGIGTEVVNNFEKTMQTIGKKVTIHRYEAGHGFANPSNPSFDTAATADSHQKTIAFLKALQ